MHALLCINFTIRRTATVDYFNLQTHSLHLRILNDNMQKSFTEGLNSISQRVLFFFKWGTVPEHYNPPSKSLANQVSQASCCEAVELKLIMIYESVVELGGC